MFLAAGRVECGSAVGVFHQWVAHGRTGPQAGWDFSTNPRRARTPHSTRTRSPHSPPKRVSCCLPAQALAPPLRKAGFCAARGGGL